MTIPNYLLDFMLYNCYSPWFVKNVLTKNAKISFFYLFAPQNELKLKTIFDENELYLNV